MPHLSLFLVNLCCLLLIAHGSASAQDPICSDDSRFENRRLAEDKIDNICQTYKNKVMLVVNTASRCAYTDQYDGLEALYRKYRRQGLVVIGFPSNDFGAQEPGTEKSIKDFCRLTYGVEFPMYSKTKVIGRHADPFYQKLKQVSGQSPRWNFHKYLIDRKGHLVNSYRSSVSPKNSQLIDDIEHALNRPE